MKRVVISLIAVAAMLALMMQVLAQQAGYPQKGKAITLYVPYGAGGSSDAAYRTLAAELEKELGTTVEVLNKPGAGAQVGITEFVAKAKPDGYTLIGTNLPGVITLYLNPQRQAIFAKKSFMPIAMLTVDPAAIAVSADSPYKTMKDLVEAAKANPGKIRAATTGLLSDDHLEILDLQRDTGTKFAIVHFDSNSDREPALLGAKIEASFGNVGSFYPLFKAGKIRILGVMDKQEFKLLLGIPTLESQGYKTYGAAARGIYAPEGTPREIVTLLSNAIKKIAASPEYQKKMENLGQPVRFLDSAQLTSYWNEVEASVKPLMEQALSEQK